MGKILKLPTMLVDLHQALIVNAFYIKPKKRVTFHKDNRKWPEIVHINTKQKTVFS